MTFSDVDTSSESEYFETSSQLIEEEKPTQDSYEALRRDNQVLKERNSVQEQLIQTLSDDLDFSRQATDDCNGRLERYKNYNSQLKEDRTYYKERRNYYQEELAKKRVRQQRSDTRYMELKNVGDTVKLNDRDSGSLVW